MTTQRAVAKPPQDFKDEIVFEGYVENPNTGERTYVCRGLDLMKIITETDAKVEELLPEAKSECVLLKVFINGEFKHETSYGCPWTENKWAKEKAENERSSFLSKFSSEQLIWEVYKRKDIFIHNWYSKELLLKLLDIHEPYIDCFLRMKSGERSETLSDVWEQWKEDVGQDLSDVVEQWTDQYPYAFRIKMEYSQELGFHATYTGDPTDEMYETFRPYQGNLKTHIEEELQEIINKYLEENYL